MKINFLFNWKEKGKQLKKTHRHAVPLIYLILFLPQFLLITAKRERQKKQMVMGVYIGQYEGAEVTDPLEDVGILMEECEVLQH